MTIAQCSALLRLCVLVALAFGFLGFLASTRTAAAGVRLHSGFGVPTGIAIEEEPR
jgi:hypothetical protein